jgi:hypothetical protein
MACTGAAGPGTAPPPSSGQDHDRKQLRSKREVDGPPNCFAPEDSQRARPSPSHGAGSGRGAGREASSRSAGVSSPECREAKWLRAVATPRSKSHDAALPHDRVGRETSASFESGLASRRTLSVGSLSARRGGVPVAMGSRRKAGGFIRRSYGRRLPSECEPAASKPLFFATFGRVRGSIKGGDREGSDLLRGPRWQGITAAAGPIMDRQRGTFAKT